MCELSVLTFLCENKSVDCVQVPVLMPVMVLAGCLKVGLLGALVHFTATASSIAYLWAWESSDFCHHQPIRMVNSL
jgi:hypothetical protein